MIANSCMETQYEFDSLNLYFKVIKFANFPKTISFFTFLFNNLNSKIKKPLQNNFHYSLQFLTINTPIIALEFPNDRN